MINIFNNKTDDRIIKLRHEGMLERETGIWGSKVTIQSSHNMLEKRSDVNMTNFNKR